VAHTASPVKALISQNGINIPVDLGSAGFLGRYRDLMNHD